MFKVQGVKMLSECLKLDFDDSLNCENRLVKMLSETQKLEFVYDYMGRRREKQVFAKDNGVWTLTTHKKFVYNKYKLIKEIDALTDTIKQRFTWLGDNLLSLHENNENYLYIADGNKNICQLVNLSDGTITNKYDYTPFGKLAQTVEEIEQAFKFSSEYAETETSLIYYNYRYYNPANAKWLSRDPIEEKGGLNIYGFVGNKPINNTDSLGKFFFTASVVTGVILNLLTDVLEVINNEILFAMSSKCAKKCPSECKSCCGNSGATAIGVLMASLFIAEGSCFLLINPWAITGCLVRTKAKFLYNLSSISRQTESCKKGCK